MDNNSRKSNNEQALKSPVLFYTLLIGFLIAFFGFAVYLPSAHARQEHERENLRPLALEQRTISDVQEVRSVASMHDDESDKATSEDTQTESKKYEAVKRNAK